MLVDMYTYVPVHEYRIYAGHWACASVVARLRSVVGKEWVKLASARGRLID